MKLLSILCLSILMGIPAQAEVLVWFGTWKQVDTRSDGTVKVPGKVTILMESNTLETRLIVATKKGGKKVNIFYSDGLGVSDTVKGPGEIKTLTSVSGVTFPNFFHIADYLQLSGAVAALPFTPGGTTIDLPKRISGKFHRSRGYYQDEEEFTENVKATLRVSFQKVDTAEVNEAGQTLDDAINGVLEYYQEKGYAMPAA
jgi:hypothetical protein